jgi:DNA-binding transcriptional regulator YhcF (GntR family)
VSTQDDKPPAGVPGDFLKLVVDRDAEVPIGIQIAWALRSRIGDGRLTPGQRLPGLREMAEASGVNVNTIRAVCQRLEQEGLIDSQQGSGTFVAATPQTPSSAGQIAAGAAREALETGVDPREVAAVLYVSAEHTELSRDEGVEQRRVLRAQIAALERTVAEMEAAYPGLVPPPTGANEGIGPALLSAEELEYVRAGLVRRLAAIQQGIDSQFVQPSEDARSASAKGRAKAKANTKVALTPTNGTAKRSPKPRSSTRPAPAGT